MCLAAGRQVSSCALRAPRLPAGVCCSPRTPAPPRPDCGAPYGGGSERPAPRRGARGCGSAGPFAPGTARAVTRQPTRGPSLRGGVRPALPGPFRQRPAAGAVSPPLGSSGIGARSSWCRWLAWVQAALHRNPARRRLLWVRLHPRRGRRAHPPRITSEAPPGTAEAEPGPSSLQRRRPGGAGSGNIPTRARRAPERATSRSAWAVGAAG